MKKLVAFVLMASIGMFSFVGCTPTEKGGAAPAAPAAPEKPAEKK
jgi:hypothetical protein